MRHRPQVLRECIEAAEPYPIAGLHSILEVPRRQLRSIGMVASAGFQRGGALSMSL